jgi:hypothetical protein
MSPSLSLAVSARESSELALSPVSLHPAVDERGRALPGTLVFDTDGGQLDITHLVPRRPRVFGSIDTFHAWIVGALRAQVVERENGTIGTSLEYKASTTVRYDAELGDYVMVGDPVEAIVGGTEGYVVIDGVRHCTSRSAPCAVEDGLVDLESRDRTLVGQLAFGSDPAGRFGIHGRSFHTNGACRPFYQVQGAHTLQWYGGIKLAVLQSGRSDWCVVIRGESTLGVAYAARRGASFVTSGGAASKNVLGVVAARADWGWWPFTKTDNVCAVHTALAGTDSIAIASGTVVGRPSQG